MAGLHGTSSSPDPAVCPFEVPRPVMLQRWERLTFLHWRYEAATVQRLLPDGLAVDTHGGSAWVGVVPFLMTVRIPGVPALPWLSRFCETNVRTYVREASTGEAGIWFFSLDAARLPAVLGARAGYRLPYFWSRMSCSGAGPVVRYASTRRWPGRRGARCAVTVTVGRPMAPAEVTALEHFLTARWTLFSRVRAGRLARVSASHPPWPLRRTDGTVADEELVAAAGLPPPHGEPLAHFSPGVEVRIGGLREGTR
jgi:uncharacterized protein